MGPRTYDFSNYQDPLGALVSGAAHGFAGVRNFVTQQKEADEDMQYKQLLARLMIRKQQEDEANNGFGPYATPGNSGGTGGSSSSQIGNQTQSGAGAFTLDRQARGNQTQAGFGGSIAAPTAVDRVTREPQDFSAANPTVNKKGFFARIFSGPDIPQIGTDIGPRRGPTMHQQDMAIQHGYDVEDATTAFGRAQQLEGQRAQDARDLEALRGKNEMDRARLTARHADATERRQEAMQAIGYLREQRMMAHAAVEEAAKQLPRNDASGIFDQRSPQERQQAIDNYQAARQREKDLGDAESKLSKRFIGVELGGEPSAAPPPSATDTSTTGDVTTGTPSLAPVVVTHPGSAQPARSFTDTIATLSNDVQPNRPAVPGFAPADQSSFRVPPPVTPPAAAPQQAPTAAPSDQAGAPKKTVPDQDAYDQLRRIMTPEQIAARYNIASGINQH